MSSPVRTPEFYYRVTMDDGKTHFLNEAEYRKLVDSLSLPPTPKNPVFVTQVAPADRPRCTNNPNTCKVSYCGWPRCWSEQG